MTEDILEPELPIIDPHHHLWDLRPVLAAFPEPRHDFLETLAGAPHYTFDQLQADTGGGRADGHNVIATVFMECGAFYDASRGEDLKVVGEVEFVNGVAAGILFFVCNRIDLYFIHTFFNWPVVFVFGNVMYIKNGHYFGCYFS